MTDDEIATLWMEASRRAKQPQCVYPQADTLREFARDMWAHGLAAGQADIPGGNPIPCPL